MGWEEDLNRQGKNHLGVVFSDTYVVSWKHLLKKTSLRVPQKNSSSVDHIIFLIIC